MIKTLTPWLRKSRVFSTNDRIEWRLFLFPGDTSSMIATTSPSGW